ncbi:putative oxidoreductase SERP2049 [Anticarsia gemmatalis]|uniref:putative oxidoreductase SERP2049 n=1 Tax=Anticarsia gemmatalis TaxID=129554 RepID=UPI003F77435D
MIFNNKVVIVTGASAGIGAAIAVKFAEEKATIVLVARNEKRLYYVAEKCQNHGSKTLTIVADLTIDSDIENVIKMAVDMFGRIDILVNNAGTIAAAAVYEENAMKVFDKLMSINLRPAVYLTNLASPYLIKTKGNIINICSISSTDPIADGLSANCMSKAAMDQFTKSAALDLGPKGVRVNSVNPGPVRTNIIENLGISKGDVDKVWKKWEERGVLGRISVPEEIADMVVFLASDKAKGITGTSHVIDNGVLLKRNFDLVEY